MSQAIRDLTIKQRKALAIMATNGGNASKAMLEAGYSKVTAHKPTNLTRAKAVQHVLSKVMRKYELTLDRAAKAYSEALEATKTVNIEGEVIETNVADHGIRMRAADRVRDMVKENEEIKPPSVSPMEASQALEGALKNADTVELQRILFNKPSGDSQKQV